MKRKFAKEFPLKLFKAERVGIDDLTLRAPELKSLRKNKIAVIGLGNLGAPSVIEFAKAGIGELRILDYDFVEGGTIVRWPFGLEAVGHGKVEYLTKFIRENFPYSEIIPKFFRLGATELINGESELDILNELFEGIDLLYDSTAEYGVQHLLSNLCKERKIPYVCVSTTFGIWGGRIYRIVPDKTVGCWICLQMFRENEEWIPNSDPKGQVHPKGCAAPTFTGANFDSLQISSAAVRLAIATLCDGVEGGYPNFDWDVGIVNLRDAGGRIIAPNWKTFKLIKHENCPECNKK